MKYTKEIFLNDKTGTPKQKLPKNRFVYYSEPSAVEADKQTFSSWMDGLVSTKNATRFFRNRNLFENISEEDFVQNANWLGYFRSENCAQVQLERGS